MIERYTVHIPAAQAAVALNAVITIYARKAAALASAAGAYRITRDELPALEDARRELIEIEDVLDAIGPRPRLGDADVELAGRVAVVREVLYATLLTAIDATRTACRDYEHGRTDRPALAAAVADVTTLHELFATLEETDAPDTS